MEKKLDLARQLGKEYGLNWYLQILGVFKFSGHRSERRPNVSQENKGLKGKVLQVGGETSRPRLPQDPTRARSLTWVQSESQTPAVVAQGRGLGTKEAGSPTSAQRSEDDPQGDKGELNLIRGFQPKLFQVLCADCTGIKYAGRARKAYLNLMAMIDPRSSWVVSRAGRKSAKRELALRCWEAVRKNLAKVGQDPQRLMLHHYQDTVYPRYRWLRQLLVEGKVMTSYWERGARDNPRMESFWWHFKEENNSLFLDAATFEELELLIARQMRYYNFERRHSRLDYQSPIGYFVSEEFILVTLAKYEGKTGYALRT